MALTRLEKPTDSVQRSKLKWIGRWDPERFEIEKAARLFDRPKARKPGGA